MSNIRRFIGLPLSAIAISISIVALSGNETHAVEQPLPLWKAQQIISQQSEVVSEKESLLKVVSTEVEDLEAKKQTLAEKLETEKQAIADLQKRIAERKAAIEAQKQAAIQSRQAVVRSGTTVRGYAGNSAGNTYAPGYCTWYTKNRRPDLPNNLGNANTWYERAAAQGLSVGTTPRVGAIGTTTAGGLGHTVYVENVSADGQLVTISEMNYGGLYRMNTRTVPAQMFKYIY